MKTVLIFAHECAPYNRQASTIGAQRPAQFAKYLPGAGWRAIVICCDAKHARTAKKEDLPRIIDNAIQLITNADPTKSVIVPVPSLIYSGLIDRAWYSLIKTNTDGSIAGKGRLSSIIRKPFTFLKLFTGDYSESWQPTAMAVASKIHEQVNVDVCIAEHGPDASLFLARSFSKKYKVPWITDFRDPILRGFNGLKKYIYKKYSRHLLTTAKATISVNSYLQTLDEAHFNLPGYTITNGYDKEEFENIATEKNGKFIISYFGSYGSSQDIDLFLRGFKSFIDSVDSDDKHSIVFSYTGLKHKDINQRASKYSIESNVETKDYVPRHEALKKMLQSDILLLLAFAPYLVTELYFKEGVQPGKVFEYMACKRPVLSIPKDNGMLDKLITYTNIGINLSDELEISSYLLRSFYNWKKGLPVLYEPNIDKTRLYTRESLALQLANILNGYVLA